MSVQFSYSQLVPNGDELGEEDCSARERAQRMTGLVDRVLESPEVQGCLRQAFEQALLEVDRAAGESVLQGAGTHTGLTTDDTLSTLNTLNTFKSEFTVAKSLAKPLARGTKQSFWHEAQAHNRHSLLYELSFGGSGIPGRISHQLVRAHDWIMHIREPDRSSGLTGYINGFVYSFAFQFLTNVIILYNGIETAWSADYAVHMQPRPRFLQASESIFLCFYSFELLLKLSIHRLYFFCNDQWAWNSLDILLVTQFVSDAFAKSIGHEIANQRTTRLTFMRVVRLLRVMRTLRVLKLMRSFQDIELLLESLFSCLVPLFWMIFIVFFVVFIFALVILQGATTYLRGECASFDEDVAEAMRIRFGSLWRCVLSLYKAGTGGQSWEVFYDLVAHIDAFNATVFILFTAFFMIAVWNIIIGLMIDKVMTTARTDRERFALSWRRDKVLKHVEFEEALQEIDPDNTGRITWKAFSRQLADPNGGLVPHLAALDLDIRSVEVFFKSMQHLHQSASIPIEGFIEGCVRMAGDASSLDLHLLSVQVNAIHEVQMRILTHLDQRFPPSS